MKYDKFSATYLLIFLGLSIVTMLPVAQADTIELENAGEGSGPKYAVGVFLGYTHAHEENEPTFGLEAGLNLSRKWSAGAVIEQTDRGNDTTLILLGIGFHPTEKLRLQLGLGRKDPSGEKENVLRLGFAYEFELADEWFIKPYAAYDFIEHEDGEPVVGLYFGRAF